MARRPKQSVDLSGFQVVALPKATVRPECFGEFDDCTGLYCQEFRDPCREITMTGSIVASLQYRQNVPNDAESYPATVVRFLLDHQHEYVVLQETTIAAVRVVFNYYEIEADLNDRGQYRLRRIKGQDVEHLRYDVDDVNGLLLIRRSE